MRTFHQLLKILMVYAITAYINNTNMFISIRYHLALSATSGSYKSAGLPNICGQVTFGKTGFSYPIAVYETSKYAGKSAINPCFENSIFGINSSSGTATSNTGLELNASRHNSIYSDNITTVQPNSFTVRYIIKY